MTTAILAFVIGAYSALVPMPNIAPYDNTSGRDAYSMCHNMLQARMDAAFGTAAVPYPVGDTPTFMLDQLHQPFPAAVRFSNARMDAVSRELSASCLRFMPPEWRDQGGVLTRVDGDLDEYAYPYAGYEHGPVARATGSPVDVIVG
jgi:hypothetical protein